MVPEGSSEEKGFKQATRRVDGCPSGATLPRRYSLLGFLGGIVLADLMSEDFPKRKKLNHEVPSWLQLDGLNSAFFITVCCKQRHENQLAKDDVWLELSETIANRNERKIWNCILFLAMPDHVHGIFRFEHETGMEKATTDWKGWTAKRLGIEWQPGFFDHRLRSHESGEGKRNYILQNPVRAGLVECASQWKYLIDSRDAR